MAEASCDIDELYGTSYRKQSLVIYTLEDLLYVSFGVEMALETSFRA